MSKQFFTQRRFLPYFCTQFLGAFNDSLYKNALLIFIAYRLVTENQGVLLNIAAMAFILPFFLFGSTAGQLADKYEKSYLIRKIKLIEIGIVCFGSVAFYFESIAFMLITVFVLGTQSAFFGPIKYSILPQQLNKNEILTGNAYVEAATFVSILIGTIIGGFLASEAQYQQILMGLLLVVAVSGWLTSCRIPIAKPAAPDLQITFNAWKSTLNVVRDSQKNVPVFQSILAISWFWFVGSILLTQFPSFAEQILYGDAQVATLLLATFSIGIGLGSLMCSFLSGGRVDVGLMPVGAIGISFFTWQFSNTVILPSDELRTLLQMLATPGIWSVIFNMTMIAFSCGLFIVPMYTFMQVRSEESHRSRTVAVNNILNAIFMVVAGLLAMAMLSSGYSVLTLFKLTAILNILVTIYIITVVPEFFLRVVSWLLVHSVYRIDKRDLHHIPEEGPALLVCNHVSFIDPALIFAVGPRPIRFVMYNNIYNIPVARKLFQWVKSIPIASQKENPELLENAFNEIAKALENNELVCIFPEGGITRNGEMTKFQPGIDRIIKRTPVPVVPLAIRGLWGTWFSRHQGRAMHGFPNAFMKRLTIVSGEAVSPEEADRKLMYQKVLTLRGDEQ